MKRQQALYCILLFILTIIFAGGGIRIYKSKGLSGWQQSPEKPKLNTKEILRGDFQKQFEPFWNDRSTFHNDFVRLRNQIYYSLFNVVINDKIIVGKNNYFYESGYIYNAVYGIYSQPDSVIADKSFKLKKLQDTLNTMGKVVVYVAAPGKGTMYEEYFPKRFTHHHKNTPPQQAYLNYFKNMGVNYIDFDTYFINQKHALKYPIYSRYGVHYNKYGAYLVADSLSKYFRKFFPYLPKLILDSGSYDYEVWNSEHDCFEASNLFLKPKKEKLYHPYFHYEQKQTKHLQENDNKTTSQSKKTRCVFIGDSYMWQLKDLEFDKNFFDHSQFWYYGQEISYTESNEKKTIEQIDIKEELSKTDVVIILFTNATTLDADNGIINKLYNLYFNNI